MEHYEQLKNGSPLLNSDGKVIGYEDEMIWNKLQNSLILTLDAVSNELEIDLVTVKGDKGNAEVFLKELSQLLYSYIYRKKPAILREKTEYFLKYDFKSRSVIYRCLIDLIRYSFYGGGNIVGYQPSVHFNDGEVMDIEKVRDERVMSFVTDSILKTNFLIDRNFVESFDVPEGDW